MYKFIVNNVINDYELITTINNDVTFNNHGRSLGGTLVPSQKGRKQGIKETNIGLFVD